MTQLGPILAIAHRDLRAELAGRRYGLPIIAALLLIPASILRTPGSETEHLAVLGDIPERVRVVPGVVEEEGLFFTGFRQVEGRTVVYGYAVPEPIREALDSGVPVIRAEPVGDPLPVPKRSLLFALVSASTLTGAVSNSIGGERARNTLLALLSAAVTRAQIVLGKWLAWATFGSIGAVLAGLLAVGAGRQEAGPWMMALPIVPGLTTALGLFLVRRTEDVVAGTSVSLRVLPAVIAATGAIAWALATWHPLLGAAVPLGGALLAAGDLWNGAWLPTLVAIVSSSVATAALLAATARDLEQVPSRSAEHGVRPSRAIGDGMLTAGIWFALVPGPVLWGWAGNPEMTRVLKVERGLIAGTALLAMLAVVRGLRTLHVPARPVAWKRGGSRMALAMGVVLGAATLLPGLSPTHPWIHEAAARLALGATPPLALVVPVVVVQELWFRGWMQRRAGWIATALVWAAVMTPFDPLTGVVGGLALGFAGRWGVGAAIAARTIGLSLGWLITY